MSSIWMEHRVDVLDGVRGRRQSGSGPRACRELVGFSSIQPRTDRALRPATEPLLIKRERYSHDDSCTRKPVTGPRLVTGSDLIHGRPLRTYGRGRTCMIEGCDTRLSLTTRTLDARCTTTEGVRASDHETTEPGSHYVESKRSDGSPLPPHPRVVWRTLTYASVGYRIIPTIGPLF